MVLGPQDQINTTTTTTNLLSYLLTYLTHRKSSTKSLSQTWSTGGEGVTHGVSDSYVTDG